MFGKGSKVYSIFKMKCPKCNSNFEQLQTPLGDVERCTECKGFHEEPQCAAVCPVDCCVPDEDRVETEEELLGKQKFMHPEG